MATTPPEAAASTATASRIVPRWNATVGSRVASSLTSAVAPWRQCLTSVLFPDQLKHLWSSKRDNSSVIRKGGIMLAPWSL